LSKFFKIKSLEIHLKLRIKNLKLNL